MRNLVLVCLAIMLLASCKDEPEPQGPASGGIYIINEGNFNFGTADVSVYNQGTNTVTNEVFATANNYPLGDVAQSMYVKDSTGYIVVNNSAKIEVVRLPSFKGIKTISISGSSPRYFLPINDSIAYVSELYAKKIWVINYETGNVTTTISTTGWTEKMVPMNGYVYVQQRIADNLPNSENKLLQIDPQTHTIVNSKPFGNRDVTGIAYDGNNRIWISTDEDTAGGYKTALHCFAPNLTPIKTLAHSNYGRHFSHLCIYRTTGTVIYMDGDLFRVDEDDTSLTNWLFVDRHGRNFYAMDLNPNNGDVYVSDALDFVQRSRIYRYGINGYEINSFTAGIISGNFTFNE